jgi:molybdopterin-containing oxidoreductase family iron-sulfur binding subunit
MVDDEKCIGCNSCAVACPYDQRSVMSKELFDKGLFGEGELTPFEEQGYVRFTPGTVTKCDFCSERVDAGLDPACVVTCPTDARIFGDLDDPDSDVSILIRERGGRPPLPEKNTKPKVYYIT